MDKIYIPIKEKIHIIKDVLHKIPQYINETLVIEVSGYILEHIESSEAFFQDIVLLKNLGVNIVIVHGGIDHLESIANKLNLNTSLIGNVKITNAESIEFIEMAISTYINKRIVNAINYAGGSAIGISGKDANLVKAKRLRFTKAPNSSNIEKIFDLGHMGEIIAIDPEVIINLEESNLISVISAIATTDYKETVQLNSIELACEIAISIAAKKLIMISDNTLSFEQNIITNFEVSNFLELNKNNQINERLSYSLRAIEHNVESVNLIDGKKGNCLLSALFTENPGSVEISDF